jgi:hypothetical protein
MHYDPHSTFPRLVVIRPWIDPVLDRRGHDPRSRYVEHFWLGVLGPTATWVMRRIAVHFDQHPDGGCVDLHQLAGSLGLSVAKGTSGPFGRALHRCVMFGAARPLVTSEVGWEVRRRLPTVAQRHLRKLPRSVQDLHAEWDHAHDQVRDQSIVAVDGASGSTAIGTVDPGTSTCDLPSGTRINASPRISSSSPGRR